MRIDKSKMQNERRDAAESTFCISHFNFFNDSLRVGKGTQHIVPPSPSFQHFYQPRGGAVCRVRRTTIVPDRAFARCRLPNYPPPTSLLTSEPHMKHVLKTGSPTASILAAVLVIVTTIAATPPVESASAVSGSRPNIVLILSDDLGYGQPGFNGGSQELTPNMDRLAAQSVRMKQFYTHSVCAPTRGRC